MRSDPWRVGEVFDQLPAAGPARSYVIASVPRSGSTMLARSLEAAGAGVPAEYLNPLVRSLLAERWGQMDLPAYLDRVRLARTTPNGVFGLKSHFNHLRSVAEWFEPAELIGPAVWVSLTRLDQEAQAVSFDIARRSGRWSGDQQRRRYRPLRYDPAAIRRRLDEIHAQEIGWERFFIRAGIDPVRITFEALIDHPTETISLVLNSVGVSAEPAVVTRPGRTRRSSRWLSRFRAE